MHKSLGLVPSIGDLNLAMEGVGCFTVMVVFRMVVFRMLCIGLVWNCTMGLEVGLSVQKKIELE